MLSARSIILATTLIALISLITMLYSVSRPPEAGNRGATSYGTRGDGHQAVFELLGTLDVPTERRANPPVDLEPTTGSLVLLAPRADLVATEPVYLHRVREWVRRGGRVVVSPGVPSLFFPPVSSGDTLPTRDTVLHELGLEGVTLQSPSVELPTESNDSEASESSEEWLRDFLPEPAELYPPAVVEAGGEWAGLWDESTTVTFPEDGASLSKDGPEPAGRLVIGEGEREGEVIAALYRLGKGEVVVVAEPSLFSNRLLGQGDNAVIAFRLLAAGEGPVLFDEFYHGLTIRGNPLWLFARPGYGATTFAMITLLGIAIWRSAVYLGPAIPVREKTRRSVSEYIDAMSRLVLRSRDSRPFVVREVREGVLQEIRRELRLPPGKENPATLAALLARRDPSRAERLLESVRAADNLLAHHHLNRTQAIRSIERLRSCL